MQKTGAEFAVNQQMQKAVRRVDMIGGRQQPGTIAGRKAILDLVRRLMLGASITLSSGCFSTEPTENLPASALSTEPEKSKALHDLVQKNVTDAAVFIRVSDREMIAPGLGKLFKLEYKIAECDPADECNVDWYLNVYGLNDETTQYSSKPIGNLHSGEDVHLGPTFGLSYGGESWQIVGRKLLSISGGKSWEMFVYDVGEDKLVRLPGPAHLGVDGQSGNSRGFSFVSGDKYVAGQHKDGCGFVIDISNLDKPREVSAYYGTGAAYEASHGHTPSAYYQEHRELFLVKSMKSESKWSAFYYECGSSGERIGVSGFSYKRLESDDIVPWSRKLAVLGKDSGYDETEIVFSKYVAFREILDSGNKQYLVFDFAAALLWQIPVGPGKSVEADVSEYFLREGLDKFAKQAYEASAEMIEKSVEIDPRNGEARYHLARSLSKMAQKHRDKALESNPLRENETEDNPFFTD